MGEILYGQLSIRILLIVIIVATLWSIYIIINPENYSINASMNQQAFPSIEPLMLPSNANNIDVVECGGDNDLDCKPNYECRNTHDYTYVYNGVEMAKNTNYCMPSTKTEIPGCNSYTGKYVWNDDGWKCDCLYKHLYDGDRCETQVACINNSQTANLYGSNNDYKLVSTSALSPGIPLNTVYDPLVSSFDDLRLAMVKDDDITDADIADITSYPKSTTLSAAANKYRAQLDTIDLLRENPLGKKGDIPYLKCNCIADQTATASIPGVPLTILENDPYTCHVDSCWVNNSYAYAGIYMDSDGTDTCAGSDGCTCDCAKNGGVTVKYGPEKGKCIPLNQVCQEIRDGDGAGSGDWDIAAEQCTCSIGANRRCLSDSVKYEELSPDDKTALQQCNPADTGFYECKGSRCLSVADSPTGGYCSCRAGYNNMGSECVSSCSPNAPCMNGGICKSANDKGEWTDIKGTVYSNGDETHKLYIDTETKLLDDAEFRIKSSSSALGAEDEEDEEDEEDRTTEDISSRREALVQYTKANYICDCGASKNLNAELGRDCAGKDINVNYGGLQCNNIELAPGTVLSKVIDGCTIPCWHYVTKCDDTKRYNTYNIKCPNGITKKTVDHTSLGFGYNTVTQACK